MLVAVVALLPYADTPAVACTGDCDRDGTVAVNELIQGVAIALAQAPLDRCPSFDRDGDGAVRVDELLAAINAGLSGCPVEATPTPRASATETPTATPADTASATPTATPTPTPTATVNRPPSLAAPSIYRTYPGFPIELAIDAADPEGGAVHCAAEGLPDGAVFDQPGVLRWTPRDEQLGPFYVPFTCADDGAPPAAADGRLTFKVSPLDACSLPTCDPAAGCTAALPAVDVDCCGGATLPRVEEPEADCPGGRVLFVGRNSSGFGPLQNCDFMRMRVVLQSGAEIPFHVRARCLNTNNRVDVRARMETDTRLVFDVQLPPAFLTPRDDGFAEKRGLTAPVSGDGPFYDLEENEANLTVTVTDSDGISATARLRLILTSRRIPDLPEPGETATPTPEETPTPTEQMATPSA